jgi:hypothetical protein
MAGYTRQSLAQILNGEIVSAPPLNAEFNQILSAFNNSTGHKHDGTAAEGPPIDRIADLDQNNLIFVDTSANQINFYVEFSAAPVGQISIQDGAILPFTDNDIDLGSSSFEFKDLYIDGTANIDSLVADTADINAGTIDNTVIGATTPAAGTFTNLTVSTGSTIDFTGATVSNGGTFTTVTISGGSITGITDLAIADGGTGASTASAARTNLGLAIGTNVQAYDADLDAIAALDSSDGNFIVGSASGWVAESGATARASLGVVIGTDVQAYDAGLASIAGLTTAADQMIYTTGADTYATASLTAAGRALLDDADAAAQRTTLGLGTLAVQAASSVAVTGGTVDGVVIGGSTPSAGGFTTLTASTSLIIASDLTVDGTQVQQASTAGLQLNASHASGLILFRVAGSERGRVTAAGSLMLGTTSFQIGGSERLTVLGGASQIAASIAANASGSTLGLHHPGDATTFRTVMTCYGRPGYSLNAVFRWTPGDAFDLVTNAADISFTPGTGKYLILNNVPTSSAGLPTGAVWSNSGVLTIV